MNPQTHIALPAFVLAGLLSIGMSAVGKTKTAGIPEILEVTGSVVFEETTEQKDPDYRVFEIRNFGTAFFVPRGAEKYAKNPFYVSISVMPALYPAAGGEENAQFGIFGAVLEFVVVPEAGTKQAAPAVGLSVRDGQGRVRQARLWHKINADLSLPGWIDLMVRIDPVDRVFDVYVGKALWIGNIPLEDAAANEAYLDSRGPKPTYIRHILFGANRQFEDMDLDGIPDDFERKFAEKAEDVGRHDFIEVVGMDLLTAYTSTRGKYE